MTRYEANCAILKSLTTEIEKHRKWRFHQILQNMGIEVNEYDQFHEESVETLENVNKMKDINSNIESFNSKQK